VLNFETDEMYLFEPAVVEHRDEVPQVQERVTVTPLASDKVAPAPVPSSRPAPSTSAFEWERVRDYVIKSILDKHGPFPRDERKENTIFMGFVGRWDDLSMKIAAYAFEEAGGEWLGAPIAIHRFHKTSDPIFAQRIAALL
jgi:hypothetical protein